MKKLVGVCDECCKLTEADFATKSAFLLSRGKF
ncbi:hypothetical protein EAAG_00638 [Escherichia coli H001]|nr:hypothetical protein EAAG_00638 [Escherichia coli H001]